MSAKPTPLKDDSADDIEADPIGEIADAYLEELRKGTQPSVEDYVKRYPQSADEIRDLLPTLMLMEQARGIAESDESLGQLASHEPGMIGRVLGDYRIIREVGRGGMGVVYEAEQVSLGRRVALKILPQQYLADSKQRRRFEREARAAAKLHHTNIVPVFGVGAHEGVSYFVMQYIQGLGLDEVLEELQRLQSGQQIDDPNKWPEPGEIAQPSAVALARSIQIGDFARGRPAIRPSPRQWLIGRVTAGKPPLQRSKRRLEIRSTAMYAAANRTPTRIWSAICYRFPVHRYRG